MKLIDGGMLFIIEGPDGVGKTTAAKKLVNYLNNDGYGVQYIRDPGTDHIAEKIRNIILYSTMDVNTELLLFSSCKNLMIHNNIIPALNQGKVVILDRFITSMMIYQYVVGGSDATLTKSLIEYITEQIKDFQNKAYEAVLTCAPSTCIKRVKNDDHEKNKYDVETYNFYSTICEAFESNIWYPNRPTNTLIRTDNKTEDEVGDLVCSLFDYAITTTRKKIYEV